MEVSALKHTGVAGIHGRSPLLRLQSDERLVALIRRGSHHAFETLVARYQSRLHAFCRHMLASKEDAEDVLQEVFAAAYNAMLADDRPINVRPWLYRIARNRSLNHLRRTQAVGVDSMDVHLSEGGLTTADKVHKREEFRQLMGDVQDLPETQRTALLLREIDALSYEQIAEAMETTVPSVKSLLVRARVSLAEAAEARMLSCADVRDELGEVAEGLARTTPPVRRHLRTCERCQTFRKSLRQTNKALAAVLPIGPLLITKKMLLAHLGTTAAAGGGAAAATSGGGLAVGGLLSAVTTKAAAGLAAAALVTAGAVEVKHVAVDRPASSARSAQAVAAAPTERQAAAPAPVAAALAPPPARAALPAAPTTPDKAAPESERKDDEATAKAKAKAKTKDANKAEEPQAKAISAPAPPVVVETVVETVVDTAPVDPVGPELLEESDTTVLPTETDATAQQVDGPWGRSPRRPFLRWRPRRRPPRRPPPPADPDADAARAASRRRDSRAVALVALPFEDFLAVDMRVGRVLTVDPFPEARKPAWKLTIDFGPELGTKRSSAQVTNYAAEALEGRLVVAVVNFAPRQIGPFMSEVLCLGASNQDGDIILLAPDSAVPVGARVH